MPGERHQSVGSHDRPRQLNQRFERQVGPGRRMQDAEFAAWAAVRALLEAHTRARSTDPARVLEALKSQEATLDVYKGNPASFRPWDNQLRQPILLATHDAVIARAPLDRFLHQRNVLDTLGVDQPETRCRF
jgi:ABC transporter substrate binding protein (PQQ-dependent alcohol dehydrogenase system)